MKISGFLPELVRKNARRRNRKNVYAQVPVEKYEAKQLMAGVVATAAEVVGTDGQDAQQQAPVSLDVVIKDANGNPTSQINPGDEFLVEVSARDNRENAQGIFTIYTDVKYDTLLIDVLSAETAPGVSASGTINDPEGLVDDVNRLFFTGSASGPVSPLLFTLRAKATGEGALTIATAQAAVGGHQQVTLFGENQDLRAEVEYGSATVQIGAPQVTLQQAPSINKDDQSLDVVVNYAGAGVDESDFKGATVKAVRKSDGATLNAQLVDVEPLVVAAVVGQQPAFGLKFKLDAPAGGFDFADNGTWELLPTNFPGDVNASESLGTFEIDLEAPPAPTFETGIRFTDLDGNTLSIIEPGQEFRIEVSAKDLRDLDDAKLLGLLSAAYDVQFDTELIDIVSIDQKYSLAPRGEIFEDDGLVDGAGGFFGVQAPGTADAVDVVEVVAVARKSGTLNITATPDESPFAALQEGSRVPLNVRDNVPSATASIVIAAPLELSVSQPTLSENGGSATLTVTRGGSNIDQAVRVDLTSSDTGELTVPEFVIIKAGETSATVTISGKDDQLLDGTQNVVVSGVATGFTEGTVSVDVTDHEVIAASINPDQVREDGGSFVLTITRSDVDDLSQDVDVKLSVPQEFQGQLDLPETATIAAGQESVDVTVTVNDNAVEDGDRTFTITAESVGFEGSSDSVTIIDVEHSDVVVSKFDAVNDRIDGGTEVRLTVTNNGTGTARNFNVAIVHSDDGQIGNSDDQTRVTLTVVELAPGESVELTTTVDFDVATLVERFIAENSGNPGEVAKSKMVDHLGAVADSSNVLEERNADGTAETNNSGNGQGKDMDDVTALPFDLDGDNVIAALDGLAAINNIGQLTTPDTAAQDTNNNGFIDPLDAATYIGHFGISLNDDVKEAETNVAPTISSIADQFVTVGEISPNIPFKVSDGDTPADQLSVTVFSSDHAVLPPANIVVSGNGNDRSVSLSPLQTSEALTVTLAVTDGVNTVEESFTVQVKDRETGPDGLVVHLEFQNGTISDSSGQKRQGTNHGATLTSDRFGNSDSALQFDGVDDYISVDATGLPNGNASRTIAMWARFDSPPASQVLAAYGSNVGGQQSGVRVVRGGWQGSFWNTAFDLNTGNPPPDGEWVHVALTYDQATSTATMYEDGVKIGTKMLTPNTVISPNGLTIGQLPQPQGSNSFNFHGALDDVRVYDVALNAEQIAAIRDSQSGGEQTPGKSEVQLAVPGTASVFQALDGDEQTAPVEAAGLALEAGSVLKISATGSAGRTPTSGLESSADGSVSEFVSHAGGSLRGIADVKAPFSSLVVVFTGDTLSDTAPPSLDFSEIGLDYQRIAPQLQQPVFVGDGNTAGGSPHEIVVPEGAKHAYFGVVDITNWPNNQGSIDVKVTVSDASTDEAIDEAFSGDLISKL